MLWYLAAFIAGYMVCVFTWSKIRTWIVGVEAEAASLKKRASDLLAKVKSL